ncbi:MAG: hypothetical protein KDA42_19750 [Planctomycetales bacterium]|nr:hypothetical protein [Planctomycetales bacterium]
MGELASCAICLSNIEADFKTHAPRETPVAGTQVQVRGGRKNIEDVQAGDWVLSRNEHDAEAEPQYRQVLQTFVTRPERLFTIRYRVEDGLGGSREEQLTGTGEHPFYVHQRGAFVPAKELEIGHRLSLADGAHAEVVAIAVDNAAPGERFTTYNFEVAEHHTYFVGHAAVWVHNQGDLCGDVLFPLVDHAIQAGKTPDEAIDLARRHLDDIIADPTHPRHASVPKKGSAEYQRHLRDVRKEAEELHARIHTASAIAIRRGKLRVLAEAFPEELAFADELIEQGYDVVVRGKHAAGGDFIINGVLTELKTLKSATVNAVRQNIRIAKTQAAHMIIDGRKAGLTHATALSAIKQSERAGRLRGILEIRVLTATGEFFWRP